MFKYLVILIFLCIPLANAAGKQDFWHAYSPAAFAQAEKQQKLILLDLVAIWCHWCHVMDKTTYQDPDVIALLKEKFIPIKADHDARPDLAERYRDYGWPATIILTGDGQELYKRAGYIAADEMLAVLRRMQLPGSPAGLEQRMVLSDSPQLNPATRAALLKRHVNTYDAGQGGLRIAQKFLDEGMVRWDLHLASQGDATAKARAIQTLDAAMQLIDPEFGGAYQYSTGYAWNNPHYEKIMRTQAAYLNVYALAYAALDDPRYLQAASLVADYLAEFLSSPEGAFYTSQDADLVQGQKAHAYFKLGREARLQQGLPRIDKQQYTAENAMAIEGFIELYRVSSEEKYLTRAIQALKWVLQQRRLAAGGFSHAANDQAGPFLADNVFMARAFLKLHQLTGDANWLAQANNTAQFIARHFKQPGGGLLSAVDNGTPVKPVAQLDQNMAAADFYIQLAQIEQDAKAREMAAHVMRYLVTPEIALSRASDAGILLLDVQYQAAFLD